MFVTAKSGTKTFFQNAKTRAALSEVSCVRDVVFWDVEETAQTEMSFDRKNVYVLKIRWDEKACQEYGSIFLIMPT